MVTTEHDRDDAPLGDLGDPFADGCVRRLDEPARTDGVAEVDHFQLVENLDPEVEVEGSRSVGEAPQGPRAEAGAGPVRGRAVPGSADDRDVRAPGVELAGLGEERSLGKGADTLERSPP